MGVTVVEVEDAQTWRSRLAPLLPGEELLLPSEAEARIGEIDAAFVEGITTGLERYPNLQFVQCLWAGVDKLLANPDFPPHVTVARMVASSMSQSMAEFVTASVLYVHRRFPEYLLQQQRRSWVELNQPVAGECPVSILGAGVLGSFSAQALRALGFPVRLWGRTVRHDDPSMLVGAQGLATLLESSAIVVNLLPLTPDTVHIIDHGFLSMCRPGASIVNAGRGRHVDDDALLGALDSGHIDHAVLDVFSVEPLPDLHPYWTHPRVTVMPHVAAASTADAVAESAANGMRAYRVGEPVPSMVDRKRGY